ncbi:hypothetical protein Holit_03109 [Hollandina sp. SP2]
MILSASKRHSNVLLGKIAGGGQDDRETANGTKGIAQRKRHEISEAVTDNHKDSGNDDGISLLDLETSFPWKYGIPHALYCGHKNALVLTSANECGAIERDNQTE